MFEKLKAHSTKVVCVFVCDMCVCVCELVGHVNKQQWVVVYMWLVSSVYLCSSHAVSAQFVSYMLLPHPLFNISSARATQYYHLYASGV